MGAGVWFPSCPYREPGLAAESGNAGFPEERACRQDLDIGGLVRCIGYVKDTATGLRGKGTEQRIPVGRGQCQLVLRHE